jgi:hypothetical protein
MQLSPTKLSIFVGAAVAIAGATPARADDLGPPPVHHLGLFIGGGLWGGNISCDGQDCGSFRAAGGPSVHIGYKFAPRLAVVGDVWAMTSSQDNLALTFVTATANLRVWLAPGLWVQGGIGNGHAILSANGLSARSDDVPVGLLAVGLTVASAPRWTIDVALQVAQGTSTSSDASATTGRSSGLGAHFNWYFGR